MSQVVGDCPRCGAKNITFRVSASNLVGRTYDWKNHYEIFGVCTGCHEATIFLISDKELHTTKQVEALGGITAMPVTLNNCFNLDGYVSLKHKASARPPEHVPAHIADVFREGATCVAVECWNAAVAMFRLCVDLATEPLLPKVEDEVPGLNTKIRRELGLRLVWLLDNGKLPQDLKNLSTCIKDDGNDGVHSGTLGEPDALDNLDFTTALLERLYTEHEKLRLANLRRLDRRQQ